MKLTNSLLISLLLPISMSTFAAGPEKVASLDRDSWPMPIESQDQFDKASFMEVFVSATVLKELPLYDNDFLVEFTGNTSANTDSVSLWLHQQKAELISNFKQACLGSHWLADKQCLSIASIDDIIHTGSPIYESLDIQYNEWKAQSVSFHQYYSYEQVRLAALFPRITSEILLLDSDENIGATLADMEFEWTFDDGPSDSDSTKNIIKVLNKHHINATFYMLGERLENTKIQDIAQLYQDQCIGSHGYTHKAHPKYDQWQSSLEQTYELLSTTFNKPIENISFRPPYGQRSEEINKFIHSMNAGDIVLWNIDSQDWNKKLTAKQVSDRTLTLMLLKRKGIILFHDIYQRNADIVDQLITMTESTNIATKSCGSSIL